MAKEKRRVVNHTKIRGVKFGDMVADYFTPEGYLMGYCGNTDCPYKEDNDGQIYKGLMVIPEYWETSRKCPFCSPARLDPTKYVDQVHEGFKLVGVVNKKGSATNVCLCPHCDETFDLPTTQFRQALKGTHNIVCTHCKNQGKPETVEDVIVDVIKVVQPRLFPELDNAREIDVYIPRGYNPPHECDLCEHPNMKEEVGTIHGNYYVVRCNERYRDKDYQFLIECMACQTTRSITRSNLLADKLPRCKGDNCPTRFALKKAASKTPITTAKAEVLEAAAIIDDDSNCGPRLVDDNVIVITSEAAKAIRFVLSAVDTKETEVIFLVAD